MHQNETHKPKAVLVGARIGSPASGYTSASASGTGTYSVSGTVSVELERSMKELKALAEAAGIETVTTFTQNLAVANTGTLLGSGKIDEIRSYLEMVETPVDLVIFDNALTPMQQKNLSRAFDCEVMDRTGLILLIFADRAKTHEARLQVEYAQLQYLLPRLAGLHQELGRQGGGSGSLSNKGSGEKKIELDRRHIEHRMAELRRELSDISRERETQRKRRMSSGLPRVSLVGYTNAGKSTIMNGMLTCYGEEEAEDSLKTRKVLEKDMLFATLDTTVRSIKPDGGRRPFLLSDTVGFVSQLPTTLVKAFRSTLEETKYADLLLIVADLSDPACQSALDVTLETLKEIGAGEIPRLFVFNKADQVCSDPETYAQRRIPYDGITADDAQIVISAKHAGDLSRLVDAIETQLSAGKVTETLLIPYTEGSRLSWLQDHARVKILEYTPEGTKIEVTH